MNRRTRIAGPVESGSSSASASTTQSDRPVSASAPWPFFGEDEIQAAEAVLRSGKVNYWTGDENRLFEREMADAFQVRHAIALGNGTLALEVGLRALGIGPGDEVVVTPRSYFASVSSVLLCGATPVFADVDRESQNLSAETIAPVLSPATKAVMPVHLAGWPCDMPSIIALAESRGLAVIEDCAQAHGARIADRPVGSFGDAAAFSFCQDKIMTTGGEGGMFLTGRDDLWERAWAYKDHGKSYTAVHSKNHPPGFRWLHESVGSNYRMTEMQAAIGRIQLGKLEDWLATRRSHAEIYRSAFEGLCALRTPVPSDEIHHAYYKFYTFVRPGSLRSGWDRDRILREVIDSGAPCFSGSCPEIYREKAIRDLGLGPGRRLPIARELGETSLMLQLHPTLRPDEVEWVAGKVAAVIARATR